MVIHPTFKHKILYNPKTQKLEKHTFRVSPPTPPTPINFDLLDLSDLDKTLADFPPQNSAASCPALNPSPPSPCEDAGEGRGRDKAGCTRAPSITRACNTGNSSHENDRVIIVDYLTLTCDIHNAESFIRQISAYLSHETDIEPKNRGRGNHGYCHSANLIVWKDSDYQTVGTMAWNEEGESKRQGAMVQFSGAACAIIDLKEIHAIAQSHFARITRIDHAFDLHPDYCRLKGYTVPVLGAAAARGEFANKHAKTTKQTLDQAGDWSEMLSGQLSVEDYRPHLHAPKGLTQYVGARTSENMFRFYEKAKQVLGKIPEDEPGRDNIFHWSELWLLRIERQHMRGGNQRVMSLDMMLEPDAYFIQGYPGLVYIYNDYMKWLGKDPQPPAGRSSTSKLLKMLGLKRKILWARHSYGRLINELNSLGMTAETIVALLMRSSGLKEFYDDVTEELIKVKNIVPAWFDSNPETNSQVIEKTKKWVEYEEKRINENTNIYRNKKALNYSSDSTLTPDEVRTKFNVTKYLKNMNESISSVLAYSDKFAYN